MIKTERKIIRDKKQIVSSHIDEEGNVINEYKITHDFMMNVVTGKHWRLVHNGTKVMALIEGTERNETSTIHSVEEFDTEKEAEDRIKELGLEYKPEHG